MSNPRNTAIISIKREVYGVKKFLKGLSLTICVVILFSTTILFINLFSISNTVKKKQINNIVTHLNLEQMAEESPSFRQTLDEVLEPIYEETRPLGIEDEAILKIMNTEEVKELTAHISSNMIDHILTGKDQKLISKDELHNLVAESINTINQNTDYKIDESKKNQLLDIVDQKADEYMDLVPNTSTITKDLNTENQETLQLLRFLVGTKLKIYLIIAGIISMIGIILLKRKEQKWLQWSFVSIMIASIGSLLEFGFILLLNNVLFRLDFPYIFYIFERLAKCGLGLSSSMILITILSLIIYHLVHKKELTKDSVKS